LLTNSYFFPSKFVTNIFSHFYFFFILLLQALMATLVQCVGHDHHLLHLFLDILLRRGIISPSAAADWATSHAALQSLCCTTSNTDGTHSGGDTTTPSTSTSATSATTSFSTYWLYSHVEVVVERALDIVRAAAAHRRELGADMKMDETVADNYQPRDMSGQVS
jgi:hypothetical protein